MCTTEDVEEAFVTFVAMFYLFDLDYPVSNQVGLYVLQWFIMKDTKVPKDLSKDLDQVYGKELLISKLNMLRNSFEIRRLLF